MRIESSVISVSWIPSEAMTGPMRVPMDIGVGHYDVPPPDRIEDLDALEELRQGDRFRFANELSAWVEVEDGAITGAGYTGGGHIGATTVSFGVGHLTIPAVAFPDIQADPVMRSDSVRFVQTAGGRTGAPMPRRVSRPPYVKVTAPTAWTTLALEINLDGSSSFEVVGASPFPRHWVYDKDGELAAKSGIIDFSTWTHEHFGDNTPWGNVESPALVTAAESALERELSVRIMGGKHKPHISHLDEGTDLVTEGEASTEMYLLLDGVLEVEVDGSVVSQVGPGAIIGERAVLEGGKRTATLRAATPVKVAVVQPDQIEKSVLEELAAGHGSKATSGADG